jgi:hypothetical protein
MPRVVSALLMTATLALPMVAPAAALAGGRVNTTVTLRIYDPFRRDYHVWDRHEERAYRGYLAERHRSYVRYGRQRLAERPAYWRWRHEREERFERERR